MGHTADKIKVNFEFLKFAINQTFHYIKTGIFGKNLI